jgi:hypothetical protein
MASASVSEPRILHASYWCIEGATAASATLNARQPNTDLFHEDLPKLSDIAIINDDKALHRSRQILLSEYSSFDWPTPEEEITIFAQSLIAITKLNPKWTSSLFIRNETTDAVKLHKTLEESGEVIAAVDFQYTMISATDYDVTSGYGQIFGEEHVTAWWAPTTQAHPTADTKHRWPYALFIGASNRAGWSRALDDFRGPDLVKRTLEILTGFAAAHSTMGTDESDVPICEHRPSLSV